MTTPTKSLEASTLSLLALISHSRNLLSSGSIAPAPKPSTDNPLDILHDIGALTRAHTTKLSIAIRPPNIIYDAAARCVQDITQFVVPPLLATVELMSPKQHGSTLYTAVLRAADNTLAALEEFAKEIPEICRAGRARGREIGWRARDVVESHMAMLKDAMAELKEWLESNDDDDEDDEADGEAKDEDAFWDAPKKALAKDDTEAREKVDASLKKMKLVTILLNAVVKRRLAGEGKLQDTQRLDTIAELAKSVANSGDDIGMGYYEDNTDEAAEAQKEFEKKAIELAELATLANDGNDDSFSKWFRNCRDAISKNG
ncbi:uncharacterized protein LAJ45_01940 [Morchella importuna]|uniref:uncharacterized protein n=1 Tax=Morchella importuna TaxID=1174673 RepID=UPI001E8E600E|nr:uncharacterized protein LAJ45_01940 [Morchella importuna]KAH8154172.1 hypothetical protein LAJ45_01940 [Morchella importuna]